MQIGKPKDYESTVMRMAGNIMAGMVSGAPFDACFNESELASRAVALARAIVKRTKETADDSVEWS